MGYIRPNDLRWACDRCDKRGASGTNYNDGPGAPSVPPDGWRWVEDKEKLLCTACLATYLKAVNKFWKNDAS